MLNGETKPLDGWWKNQLYNQHYFVVATCSVFFSGLISVYVNDFPLSTDSVRPCYVKGATLWHRRVSVAKQGGVSRGKPKAPNSQESQASLAAKTGFLSAAA